MKVDHKLVLSAGVVVILFAVVIGFFSLEESKINAAKETEIRRVQEAQATERTEERSQFWQKLVPWGSDETEDNNTQIGDGK